MSRNGLLFSSFLVGRSLTTAIFLTQPQGDHVVASAIVSTLGFVPFLGTWDHTFNTLAALGVNIAVLVTLLWLHWPSQVMFGK